MMKLTKYLFFMCCVADILSLVFEKENLHSIFKPLLMISLSLYYFSSQRHHKERLSIFVLLALLFSWIGDFLLIYQNTTRYFIFGLSSFLLAQLAYILSYREHRWAHPSGLISTQRVRLSFPVIMAGTGLIVVLYEQLGDFRIPVIVYAILLMAMVVVALFRQGRTSSASYWQVAIGAMFFMISDSMIAINKFFEPIAHASFYIMATYMVAQYLIISGLINHRKK